MGRPSRFALLCMASCAVLVVTASSSVINDEFVKARFGTSCALVEGYSPAVGDLNRDGVEDVVLVARCSNPLLDAADRHFTVVDPFNTFFGYGNPKITLSFASEDPSRRALVLLVIHGAGPEDWRNPSPAAKFMIVNLPFREVAIRNLARGKKTQQAIFAVENGPEPMTSAVYWDGKRYQYRPLGSSLD